MAAFDYARSRNTADRLLQRFGQPGVLRRPTWTGPKHNPTPGPDDECAVVFAITKYERREIDGTRVMYKDRKALLAAGGLTFEPATSHKIVIGGVESSIIAVKPLSPGGVTVYFELQVRR